MEYKEKLEQLIDLNKKIKKAQSLYKSIVTELLPKIGNNPISIGNFTIYKTKRITSKINGKMLEDTLSKNYPKYIKTSFDINSFVKDYPEFVSKFDTSTTESLSIKEKK